jgi:hypothetical protein
MRLFRRDVKPAIFRRVHLAQAGLPPAVLHLSLVLQRSQAFGAMISGCAGARVEHQRDHGSSVD